MRYVGQSNWSVVGQSNPTGRLWDKVIQPEGCGPNMQDCICYLFVWWYFWGNSLIFVLTVLVLCFRYLRWSGQGEGVLVHILLVLMILIYGHSNIWFLFLRKMFCKWMVLIWMVSENNDFTWFKNKKFSLDFWDVTLYLFVYCFSFDVYLYLWCYKNAFFFFVMLFYLIRVCDVCWVFIKK